MFDAGVEIGQILFITLLIAIAYFGNKTLGQKTKWVPKATAYAIGSLAVFWVFERVDYFF